MIAQLNTAHRTKPRQVAHQRKTKTTPNWTRVSPNVERMPTTVRQHQSPETTAVLTLAIAERQSRKSRLISTVLRLQRRPDVATASHQCSVSRIVVNTAVAPRSQSNRSGHHTNVVQLATARFITSPHLYSRQSYIRGHFATSRLRKRIHLALRYNIVMQPPPNAGSHYYNYKGTNSIVLMAVAGPDYECIYADFGTNGRVSDGGVWNKCGLTQAIDEQSISLIPPPKCLPFGVTQVPHVFLGDDAFALKKHMMKPYPQNGLSEDKRVYNYSRARRLSENLFGILANKWRVFRSIIVLPPSTIQSLIMAALVLHNYLQKSSSRTTYCPTGLLDSEDGNGNVVHGAWRQDSRAESFLPLAVPPTGHNASNDAKLFREIFKFQWRSSGLAVEFVLVPMEEILSETKIVWSITKAVRNY